MGYPSKTYSLSDEVVEAIDAARASGLSPNQFLRRALGIDKENGSSPEPKEHVAQRAPKAKKASKRDAAIQARAESDLTAQAVGRNDLDYSDTESTPTTHVTKVRQLKAETFGARKGMADWRANRKPILKRKDQEKK